MPIFLSFIISLYTKSRSYHIYLFAGYANIDRSLGFDLEGAKLILKDLAAFHAIPLALKLKNPQLFEKKIKKHCFPPCIPEEIKLKHMCTQQWIDAVLNQEKCLPFKDILKAKLDIELERTNIFFVRPVHEPYSTIVHNDMWINNTMQINKNGDLIKNRFIDFQVYMYGSPLYDLVFFIWSSVQLDVIQNHHNDLIKYYYDHFFHILEEFGCETSSFAYEQFLKHLDEDAPEELLHILFIATIMYNEKGESTIEFGKDTMDFASSKTLDLKVIDRIARVIQGFGQRGWIRK